MKNQDSKKRFETNNLFSESLITSLFKMLIRILGFFRNHFGWTNSILITIYLLLLNVCFQFYTFSVSFRKVEDFNDENLSKNILFSFLLSIILLTSSTIYLFLFSPFRIFSRFFLYSFTFTFLVTIFFWNQGVPQPGYFQCGYYTSRLFIILYFVSSIIVISLILIFRYKRNIIIYLWTISSFIFAVLLIILLYHYLTRKSFFQSAAMDTHLNTTLSKCHVDDDTFLFSHYLPRRFFHFLFFFSFWCKKHPIFASIEESYTLKEAKQSRIKIDRKICREKSFSVIYIPNLIENNYKWDEMNGNIIEAMKNKYEYEIIWMRKSRKAKYYFHDYDSSKFETIIVECGKIMKNLIFSPKKIRVRKKIQRKVKEDLSTKKPNVIVLYFDSLSRKDFERAFQKTFRYMKSISQHTRSRDEDERKIDFFQFFNYKNVGKNLRGLMSGTMANSAVPIYHVAKSHDYVSIYANSFNTHFGLRDKKNGKVYRYDYIHLESMFGRKEKTSYSRKKCLFQYKNELEEVYDYGKFHLSRLWPKTPKFMFLGSMDAYDMTGESIINSDEVLLNFFRYLNDEDLLDKSIVLIVGNEGNKLHILQNFLKEGRVERNHPVLCMSFPKGYLRLEEKLKIRGNQHRIVSSFDVHKTMMDIIGVSDMKGVGLQNNIGFSLFREEIFFDRKCEDIEIDSDSQNCNLVCSEKKL